MLSVSIQKNNVIPSKKLVGEALLTAFFAVVVQFLLNLFGVDLLFGFLPKGWEILTVVALSVYLKSLLKVSFGGGRNG